ncbi:unnamed protein product [Mytilus edulis]|uniref:Endonuclease/exonuclease/phosphatase domain-containing protein n=1 Tax=Mytilus edulis TaxID=6550 RepID=A0A8S3UJI8_MYTED|nr:unnamed protein product [Mytilus edulis]
MASPQESCQPKKKKSRTKSKDKNEPNVGVFDLSAITYSQQTFPMNNNMSSQPYMNNMNNMTSNYQNMPMQMMASPFVTSPTQQSQMVPPFFPCHTPAPVVSPPLWATDLMSKFDALSVKMNSIDDIKSYVTNIDRKVTDMKSDMVHLSKRVNEVENSQSFISKSFEENIKMHEKTNKKVESDLKKLTYDFASLRKEFNSMKTESKNLVESKENLNKIAKANERLNSDLETIQRESMRDNLLFHGIKEVTEENCADLVKHVCEFNLAIHDDLCIKAAFRLGKKAEPSNEHDIGQERSRPILVKFNDRQKRDGGPIEVAIENAKKRKLKKQTSESVNIENDTVAAGSEIHKECWINNTCDVEIDEFICKAIPLSKKKYKQGCGLFVMIKKSIASYVKIIEISYETFVWVKISKELTGTENDYIICNVYLPPYRSSFFKVHDVDLFYELETQIIKYSDECPNIFVFGDFNARTAHLNDFVENDLLHDSILDRVGELFAYVADETLPDRSNPDPGTNDYGTKLINLCKCSGLRILNGRHEGSLANDYTYSGPKGMSVIDYLLTRSSNFDIVSKFITCNFTTYSDHAPLHIQFKTNFSIKCNGVQSNFVDAEASKFFRWNEEYKDMCRNALLINSDNIKSTLQNIEAESQDEMDSCVNDFTHQFIDIMAPFFQQSQKSGTEMKRNHKQHYKHIDKPWFDIQCKELYVNYCKTLSIFNGNKSKKNHIELNRVKKTYKDYERKRRRIYMRQEGDTLCKLRKNNPKKFYSVFKKRRKVNCDLTNMDVEAFGGSTIGEASEDESQKEELK